MGDVVDYSFLTSNGSLTVTDVKDHIHRFMLI